MSADKFPQVPPPAEDLPATVLYHPSATPKPTEQIPTREVPPTVQFSSANITAEQLNPTIASREVPPTVLFKTNEASSNAPETFLQSAPQPQFSPQVSQEIVQAKPKSGKIGKILLVGGILVLLLVLGGGGAAYYLAQPMQEDKSYVLTDKIDLKDNVLSFESQNSEFTLVGTDKDGFQRWQITPDRADKNFYRFVNRGLGESKSLEVVDDNQDSSVAMARSAIDQGQLWAISNAEGDYFRLTNRWLGDGKSLSYFKRNYYFLRIRDNANDDDGQLWKKVDTGDGQSFYLINKEYGDRLTLEAFSAGEFQDKLAMTARKTGFSPDNRWVLKDTGTGLNNLTTMSYQQKNVDKWLGVNSTKNDRAAMNSGVNTSAQGWKLLPVGNDGYFRLVNGSLGDGKSLEAITFAKYTLEMVATSDTDPGQLWRLSRTAK